MDKELLKKIEDAMDKAMADFKADEESIFANEKDTLKYKYESIEPLKKWKKKQTCIVRGCNNKSIERSHTIQKSGSIKRVSESGHVLSPRFNTDTGEIEIIPLGIKEASVFPGFCNTHERLFEDFENVKDIQTGEHFGLQLYRTVCREIVITENLINAQNVLIEKYRKFRDKKIGEAILSNLGDEVLQIPTLEFKDFKFENKDGRLAIGEKNIKEMKRYLNEFLYKLHDGILNDLSKKKFQKTAYNALVFDREIPVALAGRGNFYIKLKSKGKNVEAILNVLPLEGKTYIFIATFKKFTTELNAYMSQFVNPLQIVSLIENWMIHGSDHWFLKPSTWEKIDSKYQQEILAEIMDTKYNIGHEFKLSIFNELKMESIKLMEDNYEKLNKPLIELLNNEKKKITFADTVHIA